MGQSSLHLHVDNLIILDKLSNEQAGMLIKALYQFSKDETIPTLDFALELAITPFINQLEQDKIKRIDLIEKRRKSGAKGGKQKLANATKISKCYQMLDLPEQPPTVEPPIIPTFEEEPPPSIVEDADYNENMAMYNQIMDYTKDKSQICWVSDFFEDDMWPVLRIAMQYDAIWKDKRNLDWRDYVFLSVDENVANAINEFVGVYRTMREAIIYLSGLHGEEFWRSKSLRDVFTFKKQTMQERYERALNNLNK